MENSKENAELVKPLAFSLLFSIGLLLLFVYE